MSRFRTPLLVLGLVGALVVAVAVVVVLRVGRGTPVELPVAVEDIGPGTELSPQLFRLEQVRGLGPETLEAVVTAEEFGPYVGLPTYETIHAGSPVLKAQVPDPGAPEALNWRQNRLTLLLSDPAHLVYPLPVSADEVGNTVVAGDRVDVILSLGRVAAQELVHVEEVELPAAVESAAVDAAEVTTDTAQLAPEATPQGPRPGERITTTLELPLAKVILADVPVLRVERERTRAASAGYGLAGESEPRQQPAEGDVVRLYLELDREQAEVLSFALHNGALNLPARAVEAGGASEGFTWDDFVERFFGDRPGPLLREE